MTAAGELGAKRLLVIYNPTAGGSRKRRLDAVLERLRQSGAIVELKPTLVRGDAERFAREIDGVAHDAVVAAGGDGTINEVSNGLLAAITAGKRVPPLGIVPMGTANVLARELEILGSLDKITSTLLEGRVVPIRLGRADSASGTRHFIMMAGVGFDAHVVANVSLALKRWVGKGAYVMASLRRLLGYRADLYRLTVDDVPYQAASVIVARGRFYAGSFVIAPPSRLEHPALHACLFELAGRRNVIRYGNAMLRNRLATTNAYRVLKAERIEVLGHEGEPVQGDGDIIGRLPAIFTLESAALDFLMPSLPSS
ncbi:MAG: diacylglycerol kinase family protein [Rhodospirillales bacterium]